MTLNCKRTKQGMGQWPKSTVVRFGQIYLTKKDPGCQSKKSLLQLSFWLF